MHFAHGTACEMDFAYRHFGDNTLHLDPTTMDVEHPETDDACGASDGN